MEEKFSNKIKGLEALKGAVLTVEKKNVPLTIEQVEAREKMVSSLSNGNIDKALEIIKDYNLPKDMVRARAEKLMVGMLEWSYTSYGDVHSADIAVKIKKAFNLPDDVFTAKASEGVLHILSNSNLEDALKFKNTVNLPDSPMLTKRIRDAGIYKIRHVLLSGEIEKAIELKKTFNISEETVREQAREVAVSELLSEHIDNALKIKTTFNLPESIISDPKVQSVAKKILIKNFSDSNDFDEATNQAVKIISDYKLPEDAVQDAVKEIIIETAPRFNFSEDFDHAALRIITRLKLSEDVLKAAAKEGMIRKLVSYPDSERALDFKSGFKLSEDVAQSAIREALIRAVSVGSMTTAAKIKSIYNLPDSFMSSTEFQAAAEQGLINLLSSRNYILVSILEIKNSVNLPEAMAQTAAKEALIKNLSIGDMQKAHEIKKVFNLSEEMVQAAAKEGIIKVLSDGRVNMALKINSAFLSESIWSNLEVQGAAKEGFIKAFFTEYSYADRDKYLMDIESALQIKTMFELPESFLSGSEVQAAAKRNLITVISNHGDPDLALKIKDAFNLPESFMSSQEVQAAAKKSLIDIISSGGDPDGAIKIKTIFKLPDSFKSSPEVQTAIKEGIINNLQRDHQDIHGVVRFKEEFNLSDDFMSDPEIQEAIKSALIESLSLHEDIKFDKTLEIKKILNLKEDVIQSAIDKFVIKHLSSYGDEDSVYFDWDNIQKIKAGLNLPDSFLSGPEIQFAVRGPIANSINYYCIEEIFKIQKIFKLEDSVLTEIDKNSKFHTPYKESDDGNSKPDLIRFIKLLGDEKLASLLPVATRELRDDIFSALSMDLDLADYFLENLGKYYKQPWVAEFVGEAIKHFSVANKFLVWANGQDTVWKSEPWVADIFAKANVVVEEHKKASSDIYLEYTDSEKEGLRSGTGGFSESDPFENHPGLFDSKQAHIAVTLSEFMAGKLARKDLEKIGITMPNLIDSFERINKHINSAYNEFLDNFGTNPKINEEDKDALRNPKLNNVHMTSLLDNVRSFVARYIVQIIGGDVSKLLEDYNLDFLRQNSLGPDRILTEGFDRYIKIHEVDIPLYDKLYEEFDNFRETGRYPLEVYLGRDGIYAWIGRRAEDVARRRKMGLEGRKKLKEMGEVIAINPKYIVYPRYFRDNINYETKREFLEQEGIGPDADPLFYDTGYTGTIPEQIMKVMDFDPSDIEQRIRLLSAPVANRRVKGISENARAEVIEYIEHNAKTEDVAVGLIKDPKTGKIRHIAEPTLPEEQFYFMMVKQAISRHYWLKEQLHHEPSGNVNLDSEHFTIRIRQDYAKLLPQDFMLDPKNFFAKHGELMKGSKGEGEYPDEEVVLFKLVNGVEIVAKRIELRKAKEARKEFTILIAAKKAGLPTAEPVGFLSGKEDTDGSYLLMKKIEGRSGRKFEKELKESGKYSDEQIKAIMKQVAEKNKEMAELFREKLKIDKHWRIKDTIIDFNEETGEVRSIIPIDWERAQNFDPNAPNEIDEA